MDVMTNCVNLLSHARIASGIFQVLIHVDTKLHFHQHVDIFSQTAGVNSDCDFLLVLTKQSFDAILHFSRTHVSIYLIAWNSTTSDFRKLQRIQQRFVAHCYHRLFSHTEYNYGDVLSYSKLHTLRAWRRYLDVLIQRML